MIKELILLIIFISISYSCRVITINSSLPDYLLCDSIIRVLPDNETINFLLLDLYNQTIITNPNAFNQFTIGQPIQSLREMDDSPDDITRRHILKFQILSRVNSLITNLYTIPNPCYNPSITSYRSLYLMFCRSIPIGEAPMSYGLIDPHSFQLTNDSSLNVKANYTVTSRNDTYGEDYRALKINESSYFISYTHVFNNELCRIKYFYFNIINSTTVVLTDFHKLIPYDHGSSNHKNWCAFQYNNTILFIVTVNPFHVIEYIKNETISNNRTWVMTKTFSLSNKVNIFWNYGDIRGGTTAQPLDQHTYLSFFHSSTYLKNNRERSYFFGAYTFTSTYPFKLLSISTVPIVRKELYEGPWSIWNKYWRKIDYIVFPMSFIFLNDSSERFNNSRCDSKCLKNQDILLSFGWQDDSSFLAKVNLYDLIRSLQIL